MGIQLLGTIMNGVITGLPSAAEAMEIFFVNSLGLPFSSGIIFFSAILSGGLLAGIFYAVKCQKKLLHIMLLCCIFILMGYASYAVVLIRSGYNTPLDENNPEDLMSLILYLKRDQYGTRPLLKGPYFTAGYPEEVIKKSPRYRSDSAIGRYLVYDYDYEYIYNPKQTTIFPRAGSTEERHQEGYRKWMQLREGKKPSMKDNLMYFFRYQLNHMYWRYFLWNFAGRESDKQDAGWLGFTDWDDKGVPELLKNNKARNNYFLMPLVLGLLGCIYHYRQHRKDAFIVFMLFFFSGLAIIIYLNQPPSEPRERDYTYVGSFYAFSIWIGIGVLYLTRLVQKFVKHKTMALLLATGICFIVPGRMLSENWDDHNRTGAYLAVDIAKNMLRSCAKDAILFTAADNSTFPLWYLQEVEGFRTDVRICNVSLLNLDWYIDCMKRKSNTSDPLPVSLSREHYIKGKNEHLYLLENPNLTKGIDLENYLKLIREDNPLIKHRYRNDEELTILPAAKVFLKIRRSDVIDKGNVPAGLHDFIAQKMEFDLGAGIGKSALILLDMLVSNRWNRPFYFDHSTIHEYPYLKKYLQREGHVFRLLPVDMPGTDGWADTEIMYDRLVKRSVWRGLNSTEAYSDGAANPFLANSRMEFYFLAAQLYSKGQKEKAKEVLLHALKVIPDATVPYDYTVLRYPALLFKLGEERLAMDICHKLGKRCGEFLAYLSKNNGKDQMESEYYQYMLQEVIQTLKAAGKNDVARRYENFVIK
jgi:hypothetical protein